MKSNKLKLAGLVLGVALIGGVTGCNAPTEGQSVQKTDAKCGAGKCGGEKAKKADMKCGAGKCGGGK